MRPIKFRAWIPRLKVYEKVNLLEWAHDGTGAIDIITTSAEVQDDDMVLEQYIGLKDSKGVAIYENDICKCTKSRMLSVVEYNTASAQFMFRVETPKGTRWYSMRQFQDEYDEDDECEYHTVIGNIHTNPELLKGRNKE